MLPNIVLVGFMGCGKSSVGRRLSALTGHRLMDTDACIVKKEGLSIPKIFSLRGEAGFRAVEAEVLADLVGVCGIVLATGGGIVVPEHNRDLLRHIGVIGWLDADEDTLFERATRSARRPLLQTDNPRSRFHELLEARKPLYAQLAHFHIDSTGMDHDAVASLALEHTLKHHRGFGS
jgi:shikimate kinase